MSMDWRDVSGNWILVPPNPIAIIHFLGGAFVAAAPHLTYRWLLENLYQQGYGIVATPFVNTFDHIAIATEVHTTFNQALTYLRRQALIPQYLPIYGLGHSMGCKVHLLIGSLYDVDRSGNILMAFNNFSARKSIPLLDQVIQFAPDFKIEFTPTPDETLTLIERQYQVRRNLLIKFRKDTLDQTRPLSNVLIQRFPNLTAIEILKGNHTTPIAQDIQWQTTTFSPVDALGQLFKQEIYRDIQSLKGTITRWLTPFSEY